MSLPVTPFSGALLLFAATVGVGVLASAYPDLTLPKATGLILGMGLFRPAASRALVQDLQDDVVALDRQVGGLIQFISALWLARLISR